MNGIRGENFFLAFSAYHNPFLAKNNAEKGFFSFLNFFAWVEYERNSGLNFFFPFLDLSDPILARSNAGKRFFNFFAIFFEIFLPGSSMSGIRA